MAVPLRATQPGSHTALSDATSPELGAVRGPLLKKKEEARSSSHPHGLGHNKEKGGKISRPRKANTHQRTQGLNRPVTVT